MTTLPGEDPHIRDLSGSWGPMLACAAVSYALWGISCMQLFIYASNHGNDSLGLKVLVYFVWAIDTMGQVLTIVAFWRPLIQRWGSLEELGTLQATLLHRVWITCVIAFAVQIFYVHRIYRLAGKGLLRRIMLALILPLIVWQLPFAVVFVKLTTDDPRVTTLFTLRIRALEITARATTSVVDTVIMVSMIHLLRSFHHSEFRRTQKLLDRLVIMTVNTGAWTAIVAIIDLVLLFVYPTKIVYCLADFLIAPLCVNAFLANMNAKSYIARAELPTYNSFSTESGTSNQWTIRERSTLSKESHTQAL
ncbi:hypothetical protein C8Q76DRAFT_210465 [Earliella scabrosa]|nr:hypothetical protein C8Q76DRAFT_210465 [Earliella scabrosa]